MGKDYYEILKIPKNSSIKEINKAYRNLSTKYHPKKNNASECAEDQFYQVSEAYDVLSDDTKRGIYDQFGEEGLRKGVPLSKQNLGSWTEGYIYHGNPDKTFFEFYSSNNPFQEYFDHIDGDLHYNFGGLYGRGQKVKDPSIERNLLVTLEEVFHGSVKKMKITRRVLNPDGRTTSVQDKILTVYVKKGWLENTKITFPNEGDQGPNNTAADIVFNLKDRPHDRFYREGHNLIYKTEIKLAKAILGCIIDIQTLDDRVLHIPLTSIACFGKTMTVNGEGMPITEDLDTKGDLIIKFDIIFPRYLKGEQKELIEEGFLTK